jgi:hypothetical protein
VFRHVRRRRAMIGEKLIGPLIATGKRWKIKFNTYVGTYNICSKFVNRKMPERESDLT